MEEKIRINMDKEMYEFLMNDIRIFDICRDQKKPNVNAFFNRFISGFYKKHLKDNNAYINCLTRILKEEIKDNRKVSSLANRINSERFSLNDTPTKNIYTSYMSFKIAKENRGIYNYIESYCLKGQTISSFFRSIINEYMSLSLCKREQYIFHETYDILQKAIREKKKIIYDMNVTENNIASPYTIVTDLDNNFNYIILINLTYGNGQGFSQITPSYMRRMRNVVLLEESSNITKDDEKVAERILANGAPFYYDPPKTIKVEFDDDYVSKFHKYKRYRPDPIKIEANTYYFDCSFFQFMLYFKTHLDQIKVIEPQELVDEIKDYLTKSINKIS